MNRKFNYTEQIENYLEGNMSGGEMEAFEKQLHTDPALASEFQLQQDIINAIKENRKAELKARLDHVHVGSYGSSLTGMKIALTAALTATVGLALYFYVQEEPLKKEKIVLVHQEEMAQPLAKEIPAQPEVADIADKEQAGERGDNAKVAATPKKIDEQKTVETLPSNSNIVNEEKKTTLVLKRNKESEPHEKITKIDPPMPMEAFESTDELGTEVKIPENTLAEATPDTEVTAVEIESKESGKHTFHYKFYNNKLYLYGDFKNIPYEIIELNTISGKSLYLYYKDSFYYLESNQMEIIPLQKIKDEKLVEELDSLRLKR